MGRILTGGLAPAIVMALAGCGGGSVGNTSSVRSVSTILADNLTLTLTEDTTLAAVNGVVNYQVTVSNRTLLPITGTYQGTDSSIFTYSPGSISVKDSKSTPINTDGGTAFPLPVVAPTNITITLQPGATLSASTKYTFIRADTYSATASLVPAVGAVEQTGALIATVR